MQWFMAHRVVVLLVVAALVAVVAVWRATQGQWLGIFLPVLLVGLAVQAARADRNGR